MAQLADWLRRAGFDCVESPNIRHDIWFKLWGNLSTNPISLLTAATRTASSTIRWFTCCAFA